MRVIGLMSGTSADGVDAALVEWPDDAAAKPFRLAAFHSESFDRELQDRIHRLAAGRLEGPLVLRELAALDVLLGERFAAAAAAVAREAGVALADVDAIASHGQTVAHHPELRATLQIGDPSVIAERSGVTTIADFRPRDLAVGGEGAPLAPFFHFAALADPRESRAVLNLGGIANLTGLPRGGDPDAVLAFDVGPANALLDTVVRVVSEGRESMDRDGARARRGRIDAALLARLLDDDFLRRAPPKSTGRERYGWAEGEALAAAWARAGRTPTISSRRSSRSMRRPSRAPVAISSAARPNACWCAAAARATRRRWTRSARRCRRRTSSHRRPGRSRRRRRGDGVLADGSQRAARRSQPPAALHRRVARRRTRRDRSAARSSARTT